MDILPIKNTGQTQHTLLQSDEQQNASVSDAKLQISKQQTSKLHRAQLLESTKEIISQETIKTQQMLLEALRARGFSVNQSLVSRLLQQIGAIKISRKDGCVIYQVPLEQVAPQSSQSLQSFVVGVAHNENLIVISTVPGAAPLAARILDYKKDELKILGTIAGDDTIFVAPSSVQGMSEMIAKIKQCLI